MIFLIGNRFCSTIYEFCIMEAKFSSICSFSSLPLWEATLMVVSLPGHISFLCLYLVHVIRFVLVVDCVHCQSLFCFRIWTSHVSHWNDNMGMLLSFSTALLYLLHSFDGSLVIGLLVQIGIDSDTDYYQIYIWSLCHSSLDNCCNF